MGRSTLCAVLLVLSASQVAADWSRFRGPDGSGSVSGPAVPSEWSLENNLKWRTALVGKGLSSPIVHGERVFVTAYTGYGMDRRKPGEVADLVRHLLAFDRATGEEVWRASVKTPGGEDPYEGFLTQHGYASSTPVTDGERVYALLGRSGLYAFDWEGKELWRQEVGTKSDPARWGSAASPILVGDVLVVNAGILGHHVLGLDKRTGRQLWALENPAFTNSWATPAVYRGSEGTQVLLHFPFKVIALEPQTGKVLWSARTPLDDSAVPSIVIRDDVAFLMGSRAGHGMAVRLGGSGDVSGTHVLWQRKLRAGITTPVIVDDAIYWASNGIFMAHDLATGEPIFRARLPRIGAPTGRFPNVDYSSPIVVAGKIIQLTRSGESYVIEPGKELRLAGHNAAFEGDETAFSATPAASGGELFLRSEGFLYCIAAASEPGGDDPPQPANQASR
ncbi:MAG: PQQ-binding-like beta-propeller repeat protein [Acidobacteriota bacterium]